MNALRRISSPPLRPQRTKAEASREPSLATNPLGSLLRLTSLPENHNRPSKQDLLRTIEAEQLGYRRILCFDIENKPGTYGGGDYTFPKVTALASQFLHEKRSKVWTYNRSDRDGMRSQLEEFRCIWDSADAVMGHNIKRHDKSILNGTFASLGLPILDTKHMLDTYMDQPKMTGYSRSLDNLIERYNHLLEELGHEYGCPHRKLHMSEYDWELAYDGVPWAVEKMGRRAKSDVKVNIWLYCELQRRELLK